MRSDTELPIELAKHAGKLDILKEIHTQLGRYLTKLEQTTNPEKLADEIMRRRVGL